MVYQDIHFKICLSLFSWKVNILPKMRIVHWCISMVLVYWILYKSNFATSSHSGPMHWGNTSSISFSLRSQLHTICSNQIQIQYNLNRYIYTTMWMRIQKQILEKIKIKYALKLLFFDLVLPKISSSHCLSQSFARMTRHLNEKDNSKTQLCLKLPLF